MIARVVSVPYSMLPGATRVLEVAAAVRRGGVHVHHGVAPVQLRHHRLELRVAQPGVAVAGEQADAVHLQRVVGVSDFGQRGVHVRHWHGREQAEPLRVVLHQPRAVVVAGSGQRLRHRRVAEPQAGVGDRHHGGRHAALVHVLDRLGRCPGGVGWLQQRPALDRRHPGRRREVMVDVHPVRRRLRQQAKRGRQRGHPDDAQHPADRASSVQRHLRLAASICSSACRSGPCRPAARPSSSASRRCSASGRRRAG